MRHFMHIAGLLAVLGLLACTPGAPPSPTPAPGGVEADLATHGFLDSPDGKLRVSGRANLNVSIASMANPPAAPPGWVLVTPVFNVLAHDRQNRVVVRLPDPVSLRFDVPVIRPTTILVHDGARWEIIPSELDPDGRVIAQVEHLTPYAAGQPVGTTTVGAGTLTRSPGASPAATLLPLTSSAVSVQVSPIIPSPATGGPPQPATGPSPVPQIAVSPAANVTAAVATVPPVSAEATLKTTIEALKGKVVKVTAASGYTGSLTIAVPPSLQQPLSASLGLGGAGYYGLYNAVNEAVTVQGGNDSALTLLVEPRTAMPASAAEAQSQLKAAFPGVTATLAEAQSAAPGYVYYGSSGGTSYSLGFTSYQNLPLLYAMAGSGSYANQVPRS